MKEPHSIEIAGAGPAGLAAAITLARAGRSVIVHEAHHQVGFRFRRDLQGLENWTTTQDVLAHLHELGLSTDFRYLPCAHGTAYDAWDQSYRIYCDRPIFYMLERGPGPDTFDTALLNQALTLGVEVRFNSRVGELDGPAIFATGPKEADAIAVGFHFDTTMPEGFWVICDDQLAPQGYAYLLVMNGHGTVKSCMFNDFKHQNLYAQRTVAAFERLLGLEMINPRPHGGVGSFQLPSSALKQQHPIAGEQAGFQDNLWGFGMRLAINSGVLAARSLLDGSDYDLSWQHTLKPTMKSSFVNRAVYRRLGNYGYRWLLRHLEERSDVHMMLQRQFGPSHVKRLLSPLARIIT